MERDSRRGGRDEESRRGSRDEPSRGRDREPERDSRGGRDDDRGSSRSSGSSSSGFRYQGRDRAQVEKRATMGANDFDKILKDHIKTWTPKTGNNRVRILPPTWPKPEHYGYDIYVHYGVGPDRGSYLDLDKMLEKPDPITEERAALKRSGDATEDEIKRMDSKRRVLCYIIDRDNESDGVQAWAMPWTLDKDITVLSTDRTTNEVINIDDPDEGYDVEFKREGEKDRTKYIGVAIARRPSKLGRREWLDFAVDNPLPDQLQYFTYDEIAKAFGGGGAIRDRDDAPDSRDDRGSDRGRVGGNDRGSEREADARHSRSGRGRDDDRGRVDEPELTWASVHDMTSSELDALCESDERLSKINPADAKDDDELIEWICEDLGLKDEPPPTTRRRAVVDEPAKDDGAQDKLAEMRSRRERR